jgi:hypothetical protein
LLAAAVVLAVLEQLVVTELWVSVALDTYHIDHLELVLLFQLVVALLQEELVDMTLQVEQE